MGRPINQRFYDASLGNSPVIMLSDAWIPGNAAASAANSVHIVKQISRVRFLVSDGTTVGEITLQDGPVVAAGQGRISVTPFGGGPVEYASKIMNKKVDTFEDHTYSWNLYATPTVLGQATLSNSGGPVVQL